MPIHKRHSRSEAQTYQPVSLLSIISKVIEKEKLNQLEKGTAPGAPISVPSWPQQIFLPALAINGNRVSMHGALFECWQWILQALSTRSRTSECYTNYVHMESMAPLRHRWLTNYLLNRNLQAVVDGVTSEAFRVIARVPHGSILRTTLFIVFTNDAPDGLTTNTVPAMWPRMQTTARCSPPYHPLMMFQPGVQSFSQE